MGESMLTGSAGVAVLMMQYVVARCSVYEGRRTS